MLLEVFVYTIKYIFRCGGTSDCIGEANERSMTLHDVQFPFLCILAVKTSICTQYTPLFKTVYLLLNIPPTNHANRLYIYPMLHFKCQQLKVGL